LSLSATAPLRVCYCTSFYPPDFGGYGVTLSTMLPHLIDRGIAPLVLARAGVEPGPVDRSRDLPFVHRVLRPGRSKLAETIRLLQIRSFLMRHGGDIDLVHTVVLGWELFLLMPLLRRLGKPVIVEMVLLDSDDPLTLSRERLGRLKLHSLRDVAAWIGLSDAFRKPYLEAGLPPDRFHVLHNPVDAALFRRREGPDRTRLRRELGIPEQAKVAISIGGMLERKGMDRVLRAWRAAAPRPGSDLLLLVGPATVAEGLPPEHRPFVDELKRMAGEPDLRGTVRFEGKNDRIQDYLGLADLFVFLSRKEGFGTVIIEAMASALPVLVSPLDGIAREILDDGRTGFIEVTPDDAAAVGRRVRAILDDASLRARIGSAARDEAARRFSFARRVDRLLAIYEDVVAAGPFPRNAGAS